MKQIAIAVLAVLPFVTGCATVGPEGGTRFSVPIEQNVERLGLRPRDARAAIVIPQEERNFKTYSPIPLGAWDYWWGRNIETIARSAFSQIFYSASIQPTPDDRADYEVRLAFDRAKSASSMSFSRMSSSVGLVVQLYQGRELKWERVFETHEETKATNDNLAVLGKQLAKVMADAARAVYESTADSEQQEPAARRSPARAKEPAAPPAPKIVRSDIDELPAARPARSAHAVVIGIERYREKLPEAQFAAQDAKLAAEYYKRVLGVPEENLALLTDDRATKSDFEKYFERWLPNRVEKGDEVYVFYSGHGAPNPKTGDSYLVPYDADPTYIDQTGYPVSKMYEQLAKLPAKTVLVAMDSCFSGAGGRSVIAKGARPLVSIRESAVPANITVLAATGGDQISNSYEDKGHGLFTYFFLKGLKEKGADLRAVYDFLKPEVSRVARRQYNTDQDPQWRGK